MVKSENQRIKSRSISLAYQKAQEFLVTIQEEVKNCYNLYGEQDADLLKTYYSNLIQSQSLFDYISHYYGERVKNLIINIKNGKKVLDCGCGLGSESILCGILGAKVTGVDISHRLDVARKRVEYFQQKTKKKLDISFIQGNIFDHNGHYDLIWVNEAISHIDPIDKFLQLIYRNLKPDGILIIADSNKLNPIKWREARAEQRKYGGVLIKETDPATGTTISYAVERYFTPFGIKNTVSHIINVDIIHKFGFFPFSIFRHFPKLCKLFESKILGRIPLLKFLSGAYVIVGAKCNSVKRTNEFNKKE